MKELHELKGLLNGLVEAFENVNGTNCLNVWLGGTPPPPPPPPPNMITK